MNQTFDAGISHEELRSYVVESGYWGDETLEERHAYVLSPSVYMLSHEQERSLARLARFTYAAVESLNARLVYLASGNVHLTHEQARFVKLATAGSRALYTPACGETRIPPAIKVDLVQDPRGRFFIAEVDTYNPRGFGYAALLEDSIPGLAPFRYPGVAAFAEHFRGADEWFVVVSEFERYYETPFRVLCRAFQRQGKKLTIVREHELANGTKLPPSSGVLAIPESLNQHPEVREHLLACCRKGTHVFLYPPLAYLGSKAFLPYLRSCFGMDEFITPTVSVGKGCPNALPDSGKPAVLKAAVSSGMKGVYFSDLDDDYVRMLEKASCQKHSSWVVQEQVPQVPLPIVVFNGDGARVTQDYYLRVTAYISAAGVIDVEVTGRPDRKVHGAPDCIQIPVILNRDLF